MSFHTACAVSEISQVGESRRMAMRLAASAGLSETQSGEVAIVVTELATNLVRHAKGGQVLMRAWPDRGFEVLSMDRGPGMDVSLCVKDGYSTAETTGNGLGAVQRLSHEFDIYSTEATGSVVFSRMSWSAEKKRSPTSCFQWAGLSLAAPGESVCGDAWCLDIGDEHVSVVVADGLGHGPEASMAAQIAIELFARGQPANPRAFIEKTHGAMSGTRGAAMAAARLNMADDHLLYAGIGNIAGTLLSRTERRGLMSHNGTVGGRIRSVQEVQYSWHKDLTLVMHSDGLVSRWNTDGYAGLFARHPAIFAGVLLRDFVRGRDDVTVVVLKRR